jgi:hypothetical protein
MRCHISAIMCSRLALVEFTLIDKNDLRASQDYLEP